MLFRLIPVSVLIFSNRVLTLSPQTLKTKNVHFAIAENELLSLVRDIKWLFFEPAVIDIITGSYIIEFSFRV